MRKRKLWLFCAVLPCLVLLTAWFAYRSWHTDDRLRARSLLLSALPADASAVFFLDLAAVRATPFFTELSAWAPRVAPEDDYAQFVASTSFHYDRDLDRIALAIRSQPARSTVFAVGEGRFDRKKMEAYARQTGKVSSLANRTVFAVPTASPARLVYFTFLDDNHVAATTDAAYLSSPLLTVAASPEWHEHFSRLAGTPLFAVLRQDSDAAQALARQSLGGLSSPMLATLLGQLQWISISGKPEGSLLRVVIDGESFSPATVRQLREMLAGLQVMAEMGLNDAKTRTHWDPALREASLELLQSAEVAELDRGTSKSVRLVFDVTPQLLEAAGNASGPAGLSPAVPSGRR